MTKYDTTFPCVNFGSFIATYFLHLWQVHAINSMIMSFLVGVVSVEAGNFMEFCLAYPMEILGQLEYEFPKLVAEKADYLTCDIKVRRETLTDSSFEILKDERLSMFSIVREERTRCW